MFAEGCDCPEACLSSLAIAHGCNDSGLYLPGKCLLRVAFAQVCIIHCSGALVCHALVRIPGLLCSTATVVQFATCWSDCLHVASCTMPAACLSACMLAAYLLAACLLAACLLACLLDCTHCLIDPSVGPSMDHLIHELIHKMVGELICG